MDLASVLAIAERDKAPWPKTLAVRAALNAMDRQVTKDEVRGAYGDAGFAGAGAGRAVRDVKLDVLLLKYGVHARQMYSAKETGTLRHKLPC